MDKEVGFAGHSPNNVKLRVASSIKCPEELKREREKADKAMSLNLRILKSKRYRYVLVNFLYPSLALKITFIISSVRL